MPYPNWTPEEVQELHKLTKKSGRPLEVYTGNLFATRGWMVHLSTYYVDPLSQKPRELDVLAHRREGFVVQGTKHELKFTAMISCKGFAPDQYPIGWSQNVGLSETPRLMCSRVGVVQNGMDELAVTMGRYIAGAVDSNPNRHLLGLRVFEGKSAFGFVRDKDNELYDGADSALKAAAWHHAQRAHFDVEIAIPILVLEKGITHVPIGATEAEQPVVCDKAYIAGLYPFGGLGNAPTWLLTLVWSAERVDKLIELLDGAVNYASRELSSRTLET